MCSAHRLMVLYIGVKFRENISKDIRVLEQTQNYEALIDGQTLKISDGRTLCHTTFCGGAWKRKKKWKNIFTISIDMNAQT